MTYGWKMSGSIITFSVKACTDAYISLLSQDDDGDLYEIVIGGLDNQPSVIRGGKQTEILASSLGQVLSSDHFQVIFGQVGKEAI